MINPFLLWVTLFILCLLFVCIYTHMCVYPYLYRSLSSYVCVCVCVLVAQSYPTLWYSMKCSPPDSSVHGISQARILEWVAISISRGAFQSRDQTQVSCFAGRFLTVWAPRKPFYVYIHLHAHTHKYIASPVAQMVRNLPAVQETCIRSLNWEDPLEKEMATHSTILAWEILWTEEPGGLQSKDSQRAGHDWATNTVSLTALCKSLLDVLKYYATHSSVLAWRIPGMGEPGGLPSMGSHRIGHDWSDLAVAAVASLMNTFYLSIF